LIADLVTAARLANTLGVRDGARSEFCRDLRRVLREHPQELLPALQLAATGYHSRELTGLYS
jgi:hypothetical protein